MSIPILGKNEALKRVIYNSQQSRTLVYYAAVMWSTKKENYFLPLNKENMVAYQVNLGP